MAITYTPDADFDELTDKDLTTFDVYKEKPRIISKEKAPIMLSSKTTWTNDSIVLFKFLNGEYYGLIGVGSPSKTFKVMFDTTWADIWLPSAHCSLTEIVCQLHTQYDSSASSSYTPNGTFINITNSQLSLSGILSTDTFHLPHLKLENQTFMEATHISLNPFVQYKADGIIGLAFEELSDWPGVTPFMYNMVQQNLIKDGIFTFYMNRDETTGKAGKVIFGGTQRSHVKLNTLTTVHVVKKKFWQIQIDSISAEKNKTTYPICTQCQAIFDSSANTIIGPPKDIQELNYMMNGHWVPVINKFSVNCRQYAKLPLIHFVLNGTDFIIQSKYYIQRLTLDNIEACFSPFVPSDNPKSQLWELGGAFMMEFYTEFDIDNRVIRMGETIF